jgi:hypothetical protein
MADALTIDCQKPALRELTIDRGEGWVRIVFPVWPAWVEKAAIAVALVLALLKLSALAGVLWRRHRRWGQVPRTLTASESGLDVSSPGVWRMRHRHYPADRLLKFEHRPLRWILRPRWTSADLIIRRRLWPFRFRLSTSDPQLPGQAAEEIARVLGKELKQPKESPAYGEQAGRGTSDSASGGYR